MSRWAVIPVTEVIISLAKPQDCESCLLAMALTATTGVYWGVWFHVACVEVLGGSRPTWKLPRHVEQLRIAFDCRKLIQPCSFRIPARFADRDWLAARGAIPVGCWGAKPTWYDDAAYSAKRANGLQPCNLNSP